MFPFPPTARPHRFALAALAALLALAVLSGCNRARTMVEVAGPPGFAKAVQKDPHALALRMRVFHVQQIWAGAGYEGDGADYRAKVSIWSYAQDEPPLAELYFHDSERFEPAGRHKSSEPGAGPLQIHFPMSTFAAITALMRSANEPVYLFYYRGRWCIGTSLAEAIGSE
jgi:hypothetical protein